MQFINYFLIISLGLLGTAGQAQAGSASPEAEVLGFVEWVVLEEAGVRQ